MPKPKRRRAWKKSGKDRTRGLTHEAHKPDLCAEFQKRYGEGGSIKEHSEALGIPKSTAYRWAEDVQITASERFKRHGLGVDALVQRWIAVIKKARGHVLNRALMEVGAIHDIYPAKKEPPPAQGPVTVIFNTNLEAYKDHAPGKIIEQRSVSDEPQRDAGSGASKETGSGGRLLNPAESSGAAAQ